MEQPLTDKCSIFQPGLKNSFAGHLPIHLIPLQKPHLNAPFEGFAFAGHLPVICRSNIKTHGKVLNYSQILFSKTKYLYISKFLKIYIISMTKNSN